MIRELVLSPAEATELVDFAEELARWAVRRVSGVTPAERRFSTKAGPSDLVTDFDREIEQYVRARITAVYPEHAVVGEEFGRSGSPDAELTWYLDPIDGTTNFAHGLPWSSFCLALNDRHGPLVAIVCDLEREVMYTAARGHGTRMNGVPIRCTDAEDVAGQVVLAEWAGNRAWPGMTAMMDRLAEQGVTTRIMGSSALALAHLSAGRAGAVVLGVYQPWDVMAGVLLATEAGARLYSRQGPAATPPTDGLLIAAPGVAQQLWQTWTETGSTR